MQIKIKKNFTVKRNSKPIIVAEISCNHSGKKSSFLKHIRAAAKNGADMIKIQTYEPQDMTLKSKNKNFKIISGTWKGKYLWDLYKKAHTPFSWHDDAFKLAKKLKIMSFERVYEIHTNHNNRSCAVGGLWRVTAVVSFFRNTTR